MCQMSFKHYIVGGEDYKQSWQNSNLENRHKEYFVSSSPNALTRLFLLLFQSIFFNAVSTFCNGSEGANEPYLSFWLVRTVVQTVVLGTFHTCYFGSNWKVRRSAPNKEGVKMHQEYKYSEQSEHHALYVAPLQKFLLGTRTLMHVHCFFL